MAGRVGILLLVLLVATGGAVALLVLTLTAVRGAGLQPSALHGVYLVGGASTVRSSTGRASASNCSRPSAASESSSGRWM